MTPVVRFMVEALLPNVGTHCVIHAGKNATPHRGW